MGHRILIVEDETDLRELLSDCFRRRGDIPITAADGTEALDLAVTESFDAVLLDIMMPEMDGFSVCRALRKNSDVPIIFLTALSDEEEKLLGYELGADDYVTKPYSLSVLYAKTDALIRRSRGNIRDGDLLTAGDLSLRISSRRVFAGDAPIRLTNREFALLLCLMQNRGVVLSREQLIVKCWGYDYDGDNRVVDTHIKRLREKLGPSASCIKTVIGVGYVFEA